MEEKQSPAPLAGGDRAGMLCSAASYPSYKTPANSGQPSSLFASYGSLRPLRQPQALALDTLRRSLASGHRRPMLQAPTGFGKTLTAAHIIQRALDKGRRVAFVVPALSLIDQTVAAFEAEGIHCVGVMQGSHPRTDPGAAVQIVSVQTLPRRKRPEADIVLVDEAHELHREIFRWMDDRPDLPFVGLSATPWSRGLGKHYDDLIVASTTNDLIAQGYLSPFVVFAPSEPDLASVRTIAGDFHEGELADAVDKPKLVGDVVETWLSRGENRPTLCYGVNRGHAEHLQQRFLEAGVAAAYIDAFVERQERERIFDRFRAGEIRVICNIATLAVGLDLPMCSCIVDAKPTKSEIRFVQTIGRGLRTAPGKDRLLVLDHAGNSLRLELVTDIHHTHLDDGKARKSKTEFKERSERLPRLCDECKAVLPATAKVCPECGTVRLAKTGVTHRDGHLVELGSRQSGKRQATIFDMAQFFAELRGYAQRKGYAEGWAAHKFKEKFGIWPEGVGRNVAAPGLTTLNWIRSRQIAFAKRRRFG